MEPPSRMVGDYQERILLSSLTVDSLIVVLTLLDPLGIGRPLIISRDSLGQFLGLDFELACRGH